MLHIETLQAVALLVASRSAPILIRNQLECTSSDCAFCGTLDGGLHGRVKGKSEHRWSTYSSAQLPVRYSREFISPQFQAINTQYLVWGRACAIANQRKSSRACV